MTEATTATIGSSIESDALQRFHDAFRRAMLRHRKSRMGLLFRLQCPNEKSPFDEDNLLEHLDFRKSMPPTPLAEIGEHRAYKELSTRQATVSNLAAKLLEKATTRQIEGAEFARLLQALYDLDRIADRLDTGILRSLTDIDELTGLLNRSAMERELPREQARAVRLNHSISIAMVDADHFKRVNDDYGHAFGDVVLQTLAERFVDSLRPGDSVYRYGGEEFLVLLPDSDIKQAAKILERLRARACARKITEGSTQITQSVSIGLTQLAPHEEIQSAIARADAALYQAKDRGRNRVEMAQPKAST